MSRVLTGVALLGMMLTGAVLLVMAAGGVRAADPLLAETDTCRLPCWLGITPGNSTFSQADLILTQLGYRNQDDEVPTILTYMPEDDRSVCVVSVVRHTSVDNTVRALVLTLCEGVAVGDLMGGLGMPERLSARFSTYSFVDNTVTVTTQGDLCQTHIAPRAIIAQIRLAPAQAPQFYEIPWQGFLPLWRYDQLNPDALICL